MDRKIKMDAIERIVGVVRQALDSSIPTDVESAIRSLGGTIKEDASLECDATITVSENSSRFEVLYRPDMSETRKRFSIAHEIGHLILHAPKTEDGLFACTETFYRDPSRKYTSPEKEWESNEFAASLLMPRAEFEAFCYANACDGTIKIQVVAEHFNTSMQAADVRGRSLGLW